MHRRDHRHPSYWAFVVHRGSGLALALFLPVHFWALSLVLRGEVVFDEFLRWTHHPLVKLAEMGLVMLLAAHLTGGLRLLALEFVPGRERHWASIAVSGGLSLAVGLMYLFNAS